MRHHTSSRFWRCYRLLPAPVQELADKSFEFLKVDPRHPSLHFKRIGSYRSVRVGLHHRALAVESLNGLLWFWIGDHSEYDRIVNSHLAER